MLCNTKQTVSGPSGLVVLQVLLGDGGAQGALVFLRVSCSTMQKVQAFFWAWVDLSVSDAAKKERHSVTDLPER